VKASVTRKDGSVSTESMSRPTSCDPGNGTNVSTTARNVPSTRHPSVELTAIVTVRHKAFRNDSSASTFDQVPTPRPDLVLADSSSTRTIGYTAISTTTSTGGTAHNT